MPWILKITKIEIGPFNMSNLFIDSIINVSITISIQIIPIKIKEKILKCMIYETLYIIFFSTKNIQSSTFFNLIS